MNNERATHHIDHPPLGEPAAAIPDPVLSAAIMRRVRALPPPVAVRQCPWWPAAALVAMLLALLPIAGGTPVGLDGGTVLLGLEVLFGAALLGGAVLLNHQVREESWTNC